MKPARKAWTELGWQIVGAVLASLLLLGFGSWAAWLTIDEINQGEKLQGVEKVGPCRAAGITNEECQKQARLILAACYRQREQCRRKYGLELVRVPKTPTAAETPRGGADPQGGDETAQNRSPAVRTAPSAEGPTSPSDVEDGGGRDRGPRSPAADPAPTPSPSPAPAPAPTGGGPGRSDEPRPVEPPGRVEGVTGKAAGAVEQAGKDVEGAVGKATCNPVVSLCPAG